MAQVDAVEKALAEANRKLKAAGIRLKIEQRGASLWVRGVLPKRDGTGEARTYLSLGVDASVVGVQRAYAETLQLAADLTMERFSWADWGGKEQERVTVGQALQRLEAEFWERNKDNPKAPATWRTSYYSPLKKLDRSATLGVEEAARALDTCKGVPSQARRLKILLKVVFEMYGLPVDELRKIQIEPYKVKRRDPPSDEEVIAAVDALRERSLAAIKSANREGWAWVFGMMATYGLRDHECWYVDLDSLRATKGKEIRILEGGKNLQGHYVPAMPIDWVERWNLLDGGPPVIKHRFNSDLGRRVGEWAKSHGLPFQPYHLRHAYALRCIRQEVPDHYAAAWMGHSLAVHQKVYQKWMRQEDARRYAQRREFRLDLPE